MSLNTFKYLLHWCWHCCFMSLTFEVLFSLLAITQSWENLGGSFQAKENGDTRSKKVHIAGLFQIFAENVKCRMLYFTPWIWKVAHPSTKYFPKKTSRMKQHIFELIFLQNMLYLSSNSPVAFRELLRRSENENMDSTISILPKRILFLYQWKILREEQIKF